MSENNQNNHPAGAEQTSSPAKAKHHHRHHRGGRNRHRQGQNGDKRQEIAQNGATEAPKAQENAANERHNHKKPQQKPQENPQKEAENGGGKSRNEKRRNRGRGHQKRDNRQKESQEIKQPDALEIVAPPAPSLPPISSGFTTHGFAAPSRLVEHEDVAVEIDEAVVNAILDGKETPKAPDPSVARVEVVGVRFRSAGKTYYFDPHGITAKSGEFAVVETARGPEFGEIYLGNTMVNETDVVPPLRPLIRIATPADIAKNAENREKEKQAIATFQKKVAEHKLEMKAIDVQYAFDGSKILFYFSSEGRVDFRELVKDLASVFRTRIELRQIGIRDEAKMLGGIGACGRALCCSTFLPDFAQVSIKMAKDQNLSLNSSKISGVCGRLMCCLRYEQDVYVEENRKTPGHDATVRTPDGVGTVISSNPLAGTIRVILKDSPDTAPKQYHRDEVTVLPKEKKNGGESKKDTENAPKGN